MHLNWHLDPKQVNIQRARSAAYQYTLINYSDGRAELSVQHRGDRPSETPIKRFVYRNQNGAYGGARRFEDRHGYRDPAHHAPAEVVPFLTALPERITRVIESVQADAESAARMVEADAAPPKLADDAYTDYQALCASVLCCKEYDCFERTEPSESWCATHRTAYGLTED